MKANELKKGMVVHVEGQNVVIKQVHVQTASSRSGNTLYKIKAQNVVTRQKFERNFKGDEVVQPIELERRAVQLSFRDADGCTFMDSETYEQYVLSEDAIAEELPYLADGLEGIYALVADGELLGIELPATVVMTIVDCAPGIKGASASARNKPATLTTGLVVQVPEYITPGEKIKINTDTGEFMSRG